MKKFNVIIGGFILFLFTACSHIRQGSSGMQTVKTSSGYIIPTLIQ